MNPKDLVVFVEEEEGRYNRLKFAVSIAEMWKAHVIATFVASRLELSPHRSFARGEGLRTMIENHKADVEREEAETRAFFEKLVKNRPVTSEWRFSSNEAGESLMLHARHAALAIVGPSSRVIGPITTLSLSEDIIFASGRPTLMLPTDWPAERLPRRIVVGWNGGREATRAIAAAMPFLMAAEAVYLVVVPESKVRNLFGEDPGIDMSRHLARHGVPVVLEQCEGERARQALLERVAYHDADMLVMGAYSTPKISEYIFGSVTRTLLEQAEIPLFLSR